VWSVGELRTPDPPVEVTVWGAESRFVQVTVVPAGIVIDAGTNEKFSMVTAVPPDGPAAVPAGTEDDAVVMDMAGETGAAGVVWGSAGVAEGVAGVEDMDGEVHPVMRMAAKRRTLTMAAVIRGYIPSHIPELSLMFARGIGHVSGWHCGTSGGKRCGHDHGRSQFFLPGENPAPADTVSGPSSPFHAADPGGIPCPEPDNNGKQDNDHDGDGGPVLGMRHQVEAEGQPLDEGREISIRSGSILVRECVDCG